MEYTHQKRPYRAYALQWDGNNTDEVIEMLASIGALGTVYGAEHLMVRYDCMIDTLVIGSWVVRGENNDVKCYSNEEFNVKYEKLGVSNG